MKKLFPLLALLLISCSSTEDSEEMCCQHTKAEIIEDIHFIYQPMLEEDLTDEQREEITRAYEEGLENPCEWFKEYLASSGATCENPF